MPAGSHTNSAQVECTCQSSCCALEWRKLSGCLRQFAGAQAHPVLCSILLWHVLLISSSPAYHQQSPNGAGGHHPRVARPPARILKQQRSRTGVEISPGEPCASAPYGSCMLLGGRALGPRPGGGRKAELPWPAAQATDSAGWRVANRCTFLAAAACWVAAMVQGCYRL